MIKKIIECVPNFSEGKNLAIIEKISSEIKGVDGVKLLSVEPGKDTNRTVVTFVGNPNQVIEAAFLAIKKAAELIDMSKHNGEHPRMGATDVCPLIPVSGVTMKETIKYSKILAEKVGSELNIPVYLYEKSAKNKERENLANVRSGEYEELENKLKNPDWKPDFGTDSFEVAKTTGATVIGARDFLIAYNINLNTTSTRRANAIAFDVREKGRIARKGRKLTGKILRDKNNNPIWRPGSLKNVKAIGWFIEEYGVAQISMNLTNIKKTPIHIVFDEVCRSAQKRGIRVTGSELIGLIPLDSMIEAGKFFLKKQQRSCGISEDEIIKIAIKSMGLDELEKFNSKEKIIEYSIKEKTKKLCDLDLTQFAQTTASESPAPGGGSISAYIGALGASLATMVANLSSHKRGWDKKWSFFSKIAEEGQYYINELLDLVDKDTEAFNEIINSFRLSEKTKEEKNIKKQAILDSTINAIKVPLKIMEQSEKSLDIIKIMATEGNPNSVSDAGVAALCARSAVIGGYLNVKINCKELEDKTLAKKFINQAEKIRKSATKKEKEIISITLKKI